MKKFVALAMAGAMALSMAACGGSSTPATTTAADTTAAPAATTTAAADAETTTKADTAESTKAADAASFDNLDPIELKGADSAGVGSAGQLLGEAVAKNLEEITGGKITVTYFPNSEMGGDNDIQQQMLDGTLDYIVLQTAPSVSFVPEAAVFDLPMVFAKYDGDKIDEALNGEDSAFRQAISAKYAEHNYKLLGYLQNATYRLTTSNVKLDTIDAFKGLQIRTMENANHMAFWKALGAAPTPLAWPEVYISLQNGTIAAQENAADTCASANFQEVQKYLNFTNHILYLNQIVMNNEKFESLDPAYQAAIEKAVAMSLDEIAPTLEKLDADSKAKLKEGGMEMVEYEDSFYDQVLALDGVVQLYKDIDAAVGGLGTILQESLAK
jgi:tripartite ATP-independent transporter DctP family solute receptor